MFPFFGLCEAVLGINLPDAVRYSPTYVELRNAANDYCGLLNDVFSVEKDHITGYMHSAVRVLEHTESLRPQEAGDRVNDIITASLQRFLDSTERLDADLASTGIDPGIRRDALRVAHSYRAPMWGTWQYHNVSERYHRVSNPSPDPMSKSDLVTDYASVNLFSSPLPVTGRMVTS